MTVIYMLRHAQTNNNLEKLWHGSKTGPLNNTGIMQAEFIGQRMKDFAIDAILSSDSERAIETARIVSDKIGVPLVRKDPIFGERHFGGAEDLTSAEISRRYGITVANVLDEGIDRIPEAESIHSLESRVKEAMDFICTIFPGKTVLVTSHGGFVRMFYRTFAGDVNGKYFTNCSYYSIECTEKAHRIRDDLFNP